MRNAGTVQTLMRRKSSAFDFCTSLHLERLETCFSRAWITARLFVRKLFLVYEDRSWATRYRTSNVRWRMNRTPNGGDVRRILPNYREAQKKRKVGLMKHQSGKLSQPEAKRERSTITEIQLCTLAKSAERKLHNYERTITKRYEKIVQ